jgi:hypothetical protein
MGPDFVVVRHTRPTRHWGNVGSTPRQLFGTRQVWSIATPQGPGDEHNNQKNEKFTQKEIKDSSVKIPNQSENEK